MVKIDRLLQAIEQVESGGRRNAVSPKGARGRMQVMPATARQPGYKVKPAENESEEEYTRVGRDYAKALLKHYDGDLDSALVAYNYGPGNANKWIAAGRDKRKLPEETRNYITRVNKQLKQGTGEKKMAREFEAMKQAQLSKLTKQAIKNPDSPDARKVVKELLARNLPVPNALKGSLGKARAGSGSPPPTIPGDRGPYAPYTEKQRAALNKELPKSKKRVSSGLERETASRNAAKKRRAARQSFMEAQNTEGTGIPSKITVPKSVTGHRGKAPGGGPVTGTRGKAPGGGPVTGTRGKAPGGGPVTGYRGNIRPTVPERKSLRSGIGEALSAKSNLNSQRERAAEEAEGPSMMFDAKLQQTTPDVGAATKKKDFSLSDLFDSSKYKKTSKGNDDYSPAKRTYDTPLGEIDLDTSEEGMFGDSELYDMGQKKGGRLKKAAGKKAVTKKPVAKKKAVKKNTVRKRAALRGHRAELRGG